MIQPICKYEDGKILALEGGVYREITHREAGWRMINASAYNPDLANQYQQARMERENDRQNQSVG